MAGQPLTHVYLWHLSQHPISKDMNQVRTQQRTTAEPSTVEKIKSRFVKPQNMGAHLGGTQCLLLRQIAASASRVGHFNHDNPLIHRVTHRSCGTEPLRRESRLGSARRAELTHLFDRYFLISD